MTHVVIPEGLLAVLVFRRGKKATSKLCPTLQQRSSYVSFLPFQ